MATRLVPWRHVRSIAVATVRRPLVACLVLTGGSLAGIGIVVAVPGLTANSAAVAATTTDYAPDVESLLDGRSPGSRRYGWLLDTKPGYGPADPVERVLSSVRRRPTIGAGPDDFVPVGTPIVPLALLPDGGIPTDVVPDLGIPGGTAAAGAPGGAPIVGGILPGGGGGSGGGGGDIDTNTPTPNTPASPVPEPTTWTMLILGFLLVGASLRRRGASLALLG